MSDISIPLTCSPKDDSATSVDIKWERADNRQGGLSFNNTVALYVVNLTLGTLVALLDTESWMMHDEGE